MARRSSPTLRAGWCIQLGFAVIALLAAFIVLGLGVRGRAFKKRTGYSVLAGFLKKRSGVEQLAGKTLATGFTAIVIGAVLDLTGVLGRVPVLGSRAMAITGVAIALAGFALSQWSVGAMGESWRVDVSDDDVAPLVTSGPFSLCRNPVYTAITVIAVGLALMTPNWVSLAGVPLVVTGFELMVRRVEEPFMFRSHPNEFPEYAARVGRFAPVVGRIRSADTETD